MQENKKQKESAYASLKGFHRAVPIILFALAIFIGLCFVTKNTGTLGKAISDVLKGAFSIGGYFIPALFALHALFYASDIQKKRIVSRIIFSFVLLIAISSLTHAVGNLSGEPTFSAREAYENGKASTGGGFIGALIAFAIVKVVGKVGLIIIALTVFALYVTYFLSGEKSRAGVRRMLTGFVEWCARVEKRMKDRKAKKLLAKEADKSKGGAKKNAKKPAVLKEKQSDLYDDDFFVVDNGLKELRIEELGINESRRDEDIEKNPHLHEKVFPKSRVVNEERKRPITTDYGLGETEEKVVYKQENGTDFVYEAPTGAPTVEKTEKKPAEEPTGNKWGDESAEAVFNDNFDPFDFKNSEKFANKPSSKAGVHEYAERVNVKNEEEIEKARRREEFERRKAQMLEAERAKREADEAERRAREAAEREEREAAERGARLAEEERQRRMAEEKARADAEAVMRAKAAADELARINREASESNQPKVSYTEGGGNADKYRRAAEYADRINSYYAGSAETGGGRPDQFKPFKPETSEVPYTAPVTVEEKAPEEELLIVREPLVESAPEEPVTDDGTMCVFTEEKSEQTPNTPGIGGAVFEFEDTDGEPEGDITDEITEDEDDSDDEMIYDGESIPRPEEEDAPEIPEDGIPEHMQNPEVREYRRMFSIFDQDAEVLEDIDTPKEAPEAEPVAEIPEEEDDDLPPFETDTIQTESIVPAAPAAPKEPEKKNEGPDYSNFKFPPLDILAKGEDVDDPTIEEEIQTNGEKLIDALAQFKVRASVKSVDRGPRITRYEIVPARGVRVNSVISLFDDIALNLAAEGIRMEAPIPGKSAIGVEIPNKHATTVLLRDLLETDEFVNEPSKTYACFGKDVTGNPIFGDIAKMPHILIAGATGMGKSVCINSILISILYKARPDEVKFIMIDPKTVEFTMYNGIPHLLVPVVTDVKQAAGALMWAIDEMNRRYALMAQHEVRKLDSYNDIVRERPELGKPLPKIIIVVDELNDLMQQVRKPVEGLITNITQKARAAGIHMIIGTQRPSVDVITGVIKANVPSRVSCKVSSYNDSKTILDQAGAEKLLDKGDMLYAPVGKPKPIRVQGAFVSDKEVETIMKYLKSTVKGNVYDEQALEEINRAAQKCAKGNKDSDDFDDDDEGGEDGAGYLNDKQFLDAVELAVKSGKISTSLIQRKISIGYGKAAKFIDIMEELGLVSEPNGQKPRDVLVTRDEWHEMLSRREIDD